MALRSFGAATFEEEKQGLLSRVAELAKSPFFSGRRRDLDEEIWVGFFDASQELRSDREAALAAISVHPSLLKRCSDALREDVEVVATSIVRERQARSFKHASEAGRSDPKIVDVMLEHLRHMPRVTSETLVHISQTLKRDKDKSLWVYRRVVELHGYNSKVANRWWEEIDPAVKSAVPWDLFDGAAWAPLATPGDEAPILQVTLAYGPSSVAPEDQKDSHSFHCEATLLSGTTFTVEIPDQTITDWWGHERPGPTLNDLAARLVEALKQHRQGEATERVFVIFPREDDDPIEGSVWHFDRPLSDFLATA